MSSPAGSPRHGKSVFALNQLSQQSLEHQQQQQSQQSAAVHQTSRMLHRRLSNVRNLTFAEENHGGFPTDLASTTPPTTTATALRLNAHLLSSVRDAAAHDNNTTDHPDEEWAFVLEHGVVGFAEGAAAASVPTPFMMDFGRHRRSRFSFVDPHPPPPPPLTADAAPHALLTTQSLYQHNQQQRQQQQQDSSTSACASSSKAPLLSTTPTATAITTAALPDSPTAKNYGTLPEVRESMEDLLTVSSTGSFRSKLASSLHGRVISYNRCVSHLRSVLHAWAEQLPAQIATLLLILMVAVPFGVAYFPVEWDNIPHKESLGIRMALFATMTGQLVMTFASQFDNPVAFQLLENVPFYHALAHICIEEQGQTPEAMSTLFFLLGLSSVLVGLVFYSLGRFGLGRVCYFFPGHVLVGCIGGIGAFIVLTSVEVTNNQDFQFSLQGVVDLWDHRHLFVWVVAFELGLRVLSHLCTRPDGSPMFRFLAPLYFCSIVPVFYIIWWSLGYTVEQARDWGYLFPDPTLSSSSSTDNEAVAAAASFVDRVWDGHVWDMFRIVDWRTISWTAVGKSTSTLFALCSFSLIHVPINIPAFAVSSNVEVDMNNELMAHGYSNLLSGLFGGLQNVMTYSFSVLFMKSGGRGIASCLVLTAGVGGLFVVGPTVAVYFPRCMAGTLLLHIGLDLFLEGVYDSYGKYDGLEYAGIWFITIVMTGFGMTQALLAGILSALSTYAVQSITWLNPIFRMMPATFLRSSAWGRHSSATAILEDTRTGRARIWVVQLQGHLFFGNITDLTDKIKGDLSRHRGTDQEPYVVILDFSLVVSMDSSAAHAIAKLKRLMHHLYQVEVCVFVTGSHRDGFPCEFALSDALMANEGTTTTTTGATTAGAGTCRVGFHENRVCRSLDEALIFAEDILIARENPAFLQPVVPAGLPPVLLGYGDNSNNNNTTEKTLTPAEELQLANAYFEALVPMGITLEIKNNISSFISRCRREVFTEGQVIWRQGDDSNSAKLILKGRVQARMEGSPTTSTTSCSLSSTSAATITSSSTAGGGHSDVIDFVDRGALFGELGLVDGSRRLSTVVCDSPEVILFSMDREPYDELVQQNHPVVHLLQRIVIRNLAHRVQHVSNHIFETTCLPI